MFKLCIFAALLAVAVAKPSIGHVESVAPAVSYTAAAVPAVSYKTVPSLSYKTVPTVSYKSVPIVTYKNVPTVTYKTIPVETQAVAYTAPVVPAVDHYHTPAAVAYTGSAYSSPFSYYH